MAIFPSSTIIPKYSTRVLLNSHFIAFKKRSFSRNLCNTNLVYFLEFLQRSICRPCILRRCILRSCRQRWHPSLLGTLVVNYTFQKTYPLVRKVLDWF